MIIFPKMLIFICFLTFMIPSGIGLYTTINSKPNVTFRYMDNVDGESDIHECEVHEVCNVVHNRFWMSTLTERLCRCPNGKECPWQWTPKAQNSSILLNNKSYLKFCNQVTDMDACTPNINAAMVYGKGDRKNSYIVPYNVTINCVCPETHYWRLQKYTYEENDLVIQVFKCVKKRMCESYDFCGHIRSDLYSTYYRCTCPLNHLCIFKDRNEENVQELLYSGPAYRAYCLPIKTGFSPRLPKPGETLRGTRYEIKYGGKGANQCVAAAKLGADTKFVASLGSDIYAQEYLKILRNENVDISHVHVQKDQHSGIAHITVAENGENNIVVVLGANESLSPKYVDDAVDVIKGATVLLCQFETRLETTLHALKHHKGHGLSIVNGAPATKDVDSELLKLCDIFCVNETEAEVMTGVKTEGLENVQEVINKLLEKGCNTVILTLGELGAVCASQTNKKFILISTTPVQPVDTTGAGDAFLGALAYFKAYHPKLPLEECIRRACAIATESVLKFGTHASFPTKDSLSPDLFA